jgi:DNA-binding transcriptional LysR family regulator
MAAIAPGDLGEEVLLVNPRQADPTVADRVMTLLATAGHRFRDVRETAGEDGRSLIFAVGDHHCVAIMPASALAAWRDVASLVVARPLEPAVRMPDAALAWRVDPAPELAALAAAAREVAAGLYGDRGDDG